MNQRIDLVNGTRLFAKIATTSAALAIAMVTLAAQAAPRSEAKPLPVLADAGLLQSIGAEVIAVEPVTGVGFAELSDLEQERISEVQHKAGKCGGFEALPYDISGRHDLLLTHVFGQLASQELKNRRGSRLQAPTILEPKSEVVSALNQVSESNIRATVEFLASYHDRDHKGSTPNQSIEAFKAKLETMMASSKVPYQIDLVAHQRIQQKSIRVRIPGKSRASEIVVLGGHIDSINQEWYGDGTAPGADDNASGSADIMEALRIVSQQPQPERTLEFFWYAGEEGGLLGSAEIAREYKAQNKDVVAVLQLDMTMYPGAGELTIGSMTDFTSSWLRNYLMGVNTAYLNAKIVDDKCGYGCSDHASWNRQGYPALMPFEATFRGMNHNLHTSKDRIDANSNFHHAAVFAKIAIVMAMDLGNSSAREQ